MLELRRRQTGQTPNSEYAHWRDDPAGFCRTVFREEYTAGIVRVMESVRDHQITIAKSANGVGKTHGAARIALWFYKCYPEAQVYTTSAPPENNLRRLLWGEIGHVTRQHPELFKSDRLRADMIIERNSLSFVAGVAVPSSGTPEEREAKFSGKHAPQILFIVDEGDAVPAEVYKGIESCMSGGLARLLVMFNPRSDSGIVPGMEKRGEGHVVELSAFSHPNVLTGENVIPGAVTREKTLQRINKWTRPLAGDERPDRECFEVPAELVGLTCEGTNGEKYPPLPGGWRKVMVTSFYYMVLGIYPPQAETQLISRAWVDAAVSRWHTYVAKYGEIPPVRDGVAGLDVAEFGKDWNILCYRYGGFVPRLSARWQGIDPDSTAIKAAEHVKQMKARIKVKVDGTGLGSGVAPRMKRLGVEAASIKVASAPTYETEMGTFAQLRDQLWWSCAEWLRNDPGAMLPPDEELAEELCAPLYAVPGGKIRVTSKDVMRELLGRSPDKADALNLTFAPEISNTLTVKASIGNYTR